MNKINLLVSLKDKSRRRTERRSSSRRIINYTFGSDEWIEAVQSSYVFWPKEDRRAQERRGIARRMSERRTLLQKHQLRAFRQPAMRRPLKSQTLSEEERQMLSDLYRAY